MGIKGCILLGAPGSGKGTQAKWMQSEYSIPHISTGDMLRAEVSAESDLGIKVKEVMTSGKLVSDELIIEVVRQRFSKNDVRIGYILDGFPRTVPQGEALETILKELDFVAPKVLLIDVPEKLIVSRLTGRLSCTSCGAVFHKEFNPPKEEGKCDKCGHSPLIQRKDDTEETVMKRLEVYEKDTAPLIQYYDGKNLLSKIDGSKSVDSVTTRIKEIFPT